MRADTGDTGGRNSGTTAGGRDARAASIVAGLGDRSLVLVGMMGAGKTVTGRRLALHLGLEFIDSDGEIEAAAGMTIADIFSRYGEPYFRERESLIVERLLRDGPRVLATGGGAFIHPETQATIKARALSLWIKAEFDVLMRRVRKRANRPLLKTADPEGTLQRLMADRYPVYAGADMMVVSRDGPHETVVNDMIVALEAYLSTPGGRTSHQEHR